MTEVLENTEVLEKKEVVLQITPKEQEAFGVALLADSLKNGTNARKFSKALGFFDDGDVPAQVLAKSTHVKQEKGQVGFEVQVCLPAKAKYFEGTPLEYKSGYILNKYKAYLEKIYPIYTFDIYTQKVYISKVG